MQVSITVTGESGPWAVELSWGLGDSRKVQSFSAARLDFTPWIRPGPEGIPAPDDPDYDVLSGTAGHLQDLTERVAALGKKRLEDGDLVTYGRLLFASVLAPAWKAVVADASAAGELIELALHLPSGGDTPLQTLLWELLHDRTSFLVTHSDVEVAVTRRIPSKATTPGQIDPPARVLFAIGAELSDPEVRAGAEFLGLIRELERSGSRIASCIVESASAGRLEEAVMRFKPDVVHFVAHGKLDTKGVPALLMRPEEDKPGALPKRVTAETLYACICASGRTPPMVVLAACESGALSSAYGMPIAEDLVSRGVPVAVAMAGSVADQACRLFTRRFGTALARGGSLLQAAADARRAAYRRGDGPPSRTIDWALPSVFLSNRVRHDYQPVAVTEGASVSKLVEGYAFDGRPVFCGRGKFFRRYDELMSPNSLNVLAIYSLADTPGLGKSRILREYGIRALLDGHVPCVVGLDGQGRPADPRRFAEALLKSITQARRLFQLEPPTAAPELLELLCSSAAPLPSIGPPWREWNIAVKKLINQHREDGQPLDREWLRTAIATDLTTLIEDARAGQDPRIGSESRVLVLLDTVEEWGDTIELLTPGIMILNQYGLGDEEESVPVAMAFRADARPHNESFEELIRYAEDKSWIEAEKLEPFAEGDEEDLAYRWILLNANPQIAPPVSERVYTIVKPDGQWRTHFGIVTDRVPAKLSDTKFYAVAKALLLQEELAEGDDDEALAFLLGSRS
jgi:CHAT domain-containing protein